MTEIETEQYAAAQFAADWQGRGDEKQETQVFWLSLLRKVLGIENPEQYITFELPVKLDHTSFIDGYISTTRVLIEQKGRNINLSKSYRQSDGSFLTPFQQARRYAGYLPHNKNPRWIIVCNFQEFHIHDMNRPNDDPEILKLKNLGNEFYRLQFLVNVEDERIQKETEISLQAGDLTSLLYNALLRQYKDRENPETLKSLNKLCVRLVFCLYAEDAGIFEKKRMFHDYLEGYKTEHMRKALQELFFILNTPQEERDPYLEPDLAAFPYVNGGLFDGTDIEIPLFTDEIRELLLNKASKNFDWSQISPTIFGAVFESTLNQEIRRSSGMHYTSIKNIHKVIKPLFLDELHAEFDAIKNIPVRKTRNAKLIAFQKKLAGLKFLDPACGSGNFLTETYLSLRRLENKIISLLHQGQIILDIGNPIQVSINQFYGIEINDFAVTIAKTALWIAESQMMKETEKVIHMQLDFLPIKSYANITEADALLIDWEELIGKNQLNYIIGNPPFVGYAYQSPQQKAGLQKIPEIKKNVDYVVGWYFKAAQFMQKTNVRTAFVSTNSITQGEQVATVWKPLMEKYKVHIDFAYRTFRWDSESKIKAFVYCVIIGFSVAPNEAKKLLYSNNTFQEVDHINAYLMDAPTIFIESRKKPLCDVPPCSRGNQPTDGGNLIIEKENYEEFIRREPKAEKYIKKLIGSTEFINRKDRYCLWLADTSPNEIRSMPLVQERIGKVKAMREKSSFAPTRELANYPTRFRETLNPQSYVVIPRVSSERRKYVPMGFLDGDTIPTDSVIIVPDATIYHFGVLTSNMHMAWMRAVCGRLKSDYRYSKDIVYNNFPWCTPTDDQKAKIEQTAQAILDARALYPDASLADLYDETTMPPELRRAHQQNDRAVMQAYGFPVKNMTESQCVAELMKLYQKLTN